MARSRHALVQPDTRALFSADSAAAILIEASTHLLVSAYHSAWKRISIDIVGPAWAVRALSTYLYTSG